MLHPLDNERTLHTGSVESRQKFCRLTSQLRLLKFVMVIDIRESFQTECHPLLLCLELLDEITLLHRSPSTYSSQLMTLQAEQSCRRGEQ